ncbi:hypothetical protein VR45_41340, partial [Streptomyces sp. NRRL S-495]
WSSADLLIRVDEAHDGVPAERRVYLDDGRTYYWTGEADGVRIEGLSRDGAHLAHRPTGTQPMTDWNQRRVLRTSPDTATWLGDRPLSVSRVLFDSGQEGLRITVPVRTVVEGPVTPEYRALAEEHVQQRVNDYVRDRTLETAGPDGVPPRLVAVVLDFAPGRPDVFSGVLVRPGSASDVSDVLGPLAFQGQDQVFNSLVATLDGLATPHADLVAQQGAPRVPADLREPGPLRPGEHRPAEMAGWDQQTALELRHLDTRFSQEALAADPRRLPVTHSLPREWTALDARWAAVQVLHEHDGEFGPTVTDIVHGSYGDVDLAVHVENGRIVLVTGVGDQRHLPQLHVPPLGADAEVQPAPAVPARGSGRPAAPGEAAFAPRARAPHVAGSDGGSRPTTPGGDDNALPRTPGHDEDSRPTTPGDEDSGWPTTPGRPTTPGDDESGWPTTPGRDEDMDLDLDRDRDSDEEMGYYTDSTLDYLSSDQDMESVDGSYSGRRSVDMDSRRDTDSTTDSTTDTDGGADRVRPAHQAPAPDLRIAQVLRTVEVEAPADRALHSSTSTHLRRFQAGRAVLVDGSPAVEVVVRVHLDTSGLPAGQDHTESLA